MRIDDNHRAFFALVKAGLWEHDIQLSQLGQIDFNVVYRLAEEQSVLGLVAAGIEHAKGTKISQAFSLAFVGSALQLEQRNTAMNEFVAKLIEKLRKDDVYTLLVKGQGIAQCYERPLWRTAGDVDLLLSSDDLKKAKASLDSIGQAPNHVTKKDIRRAHYEYELGEWIVELHGSMYSDLSRRVDRIIDEAQNDIFYGGNVRSWNNNGTTVYLPSPDNDVIFIFTHILQHLFLEGVGLRQICDWSRLLWTYKDSLNHKLLESRIRKMGVMSEWKVLAAFAMKYLGMSAEVIPLYSNDASWKRKADRLCAFVLVVGNFGHNRDVEWTNPFKRRSKLIWHKITDTIRLSSVFPLDAPKFLLNYAVEGVKGIV